MIVAIVMWDLSRSDETVESLRSYLRDYACEAYSEVEGMYLKSWFSDAERQIWGAVYHWDEEGAMMSVATVSKVIERIGYPPTSVGKFDLEAVAYGASTHRDLEGLGLAYSDGEKPMSDGIESRPTES